MSCPTRASRVAPSDAYMQGPYGYLKVPKVRFMQRLAVRRLEFVATFAPRRCRRP